MANSFFSVRYFFSSGLGGQSDKGYQVYRTDDDADSSLHTVSVGFSEPEAFMTAVLLGIESAQSERLPLVRGRNRDDIIWPPRWQSEALPERETLECRLSGDQRVYPIPANTVRLRVLQATLVAFVVSGSSLIWSSASLGDSAPLVMLFAPIMGLLIVALTYRHLLRSLGEKTLVLDLNSVTLKHKLNGRVETLPLREDLVVIPGIEGVYCFSQGSSLYIGHHSDTVCQLLVEAIGRHAQRVFPRPA